MQQETNLLIEELLNTTERSTKSALKFKTLNTEQLNYRNSPTEWSILQCLEHLNLYGDFYLPEIEKQIIANKSKVNPSIFKSGLLGNYFANLMLVKDGKVKKMKAPKDKIPSASALSVTTIDRFLKQQELLKSLLQQAKSTDLTKTKTAISLTNLIQLRLGDTFRFFTYHIERHILQAEKVLEQQQ
jgi:hypothetical protein